MYNINAAVRTCKENIKKRNFIKGKIGEHFNESNYHKIIEIIQLTNQGSGK